MHFRNYRLASFMTCVRSLNRIYSDVSTFAFSDICCLTENWSKITTWFGLLLAMSRTNKNTALIKTANQILFSSFELLPQITRIEDFIFDLNFDFNRFNIILSDSVSGRFDVWQKSFFRHNISWEWIKSPVAQFDISIYTCSFRIEIEMDENGSSWTNRSWCWMWLEQRSVEEHGQLRIDFTNFYELKPFLK